VPLLAASQTQYPDDFWLNCSLANACLKQSRWGEAVSYLRAALALRPRSVEAHNTLGIALDFAGQVDEAIDEYRKAIALDHKYVAAHFNLGFSLRRKKQLGEAVSEYRTAIDLSRTMKSELRCVVISEYRTAIDLAPPAKAELHDAFGLALHENKQLDEAIREFRSAVNLFPTLFPAGGPFLRESPAFHLNLSNALRNNKQLDEAMRERRIAIALDPHLVLNHLNRGDALCNKKQMDEVIRECHMATEFIPNNATARSAYYLKLGHALRDIMHVDEAIAEYRTAIALDPKNFDAHIALGYSLAESYVRAEKLAEAEAAYREVLEQYRNRFGADDARTAGPMAFVGYKLLHLHKYADAEPLLRDCLKVREAKQPDEWTTFNTQSMLGEALLGQKRYADAEPLLLKGYQGMKERDTKILWQVKEVRLTEALGRLTQLYDAWGKKDQADVWRKRLATHRQSEKKAANPKDEDWSVVHGS
jgi:tetratricopeptide (TPR) repeat protein